MECWLQVTNALVGGQGALVIAHAIGVFMQWLACVLSEPQRVSACVRHWLVNWCL